MKQHIYLLLDQARLFHPSHPAPSRSHSQIRSHHEEVDQPHVDEADPLRRLRQLAGALAERRVDLLHRHPTFASSPHEAARISFAPSLDIAAEEPARRALLALHSTRASFHSDAPTG